MDLQPVIIEYLCRQRALSLPGLGTLRWLESKPKRSSDLLFKGPSFSLHHSSKEGGTSDFINYLSNKAKVSVGQATDIVEAWCKTVLAKLSTSEEVKIGGLGSFVQEDDKVVFKADQIALQQGGDLTLAIATRRQSHPVVSNESTNNTTAFSLWDIFLPIVLIALIALLAFSLWKSLMPDVDPKLPPTTAVEEYEEPNQEADVDIVSDTKDTVPGQEKVQSEDTSAESGSNPNQTEEVIDEISDNDTGEVQEDMETGDEDTDGDYVEERIQNGEEARIVSRANKGECIVIIGSFKRDDLAKQAAEKVISRGLTAYTEAYGDFTRVGVLFDCETHDLYRRLFQLRGDFGEDAWILKYK